MASETSLARLAEVIKVIVGDENCNNFPTSELMKITD